MTLESQTATELSAPQRERASINDVARRAGVSAQTVSRVANRMNNVRPATRERVLAAMAELNYRPNSAARNLKAGRFRSIGFVTFNLATFGNERTLSAVAEASEAAGYTTTLLPVADPTQLDVVGAFGRLEEQAVDGIILVMSAEVGALDELTMTAGLPLVIIDSDANLPYTIVDTDQEQGVSIALQHLFELGHRDIVHISGPASSYSATRRAEAYRRIMAERGLPALEVHSGDWSAASGLELGRQLLDAEHLPTAVFAANDHMALGIMHAVHERGLRVPQDISVIGFDDVEGAAEFWPALSTVHQNLDEVGRQATSLLLALIDGEADEQQKILVQTRLIVRDSTGPVRAG
ncbi:LacI family DNA-binding transcriptional regulator [Microterricola pindariensis]|uniref:LacI family transcriptional regulator n=1 Tax=Microterricola pindariensis TaxID=478010 RepID=A0ABX5ASR1_9MICO|nr:LacI family DNA-binding transcriptional regulator [Microterricola pindariensis]PPL15453.1 LacI family transcriptional regulator [Microterricola pindariensis]